MHEWALAESVIKTTIEAAKKEELTEVTEINIKLGKLQQINKKIFKKALKDIIETKKIYLLKNLTVNIHSEKTVLQCKKCDHQWKFEDMKNDLNEDESEAIHFIPEVALVYKRCPKCGSPDFEILQGRGISIDTIKGEK